MDWLGPGELRVGLGCMRLSTDEERDDRRALETIAAAAEAGITVFDTAHSYGRGENELGHNERLVVRALRARGSGDRARIVTKGGMRRSGTAWVPDGRARSIRADCEASLAALDGQCVDLYLLHAPDPRTPWRTSVRALARLVDDGLVPRVGVCNVNRAQLDEALEHAPITAVQVALSLFDDGALRGGILDRCVDAGITLMAHSPLGGPGRARGLPRREMLAAVARERGVPEAELALAWVLDLAPNVVVLPGARRAETARSAAHAASLQLDDGERARLGRTRARLVARKAGDVVLVMGVPGAGKSLLAADLVARGYLRLNRDERGGSLRDLAEALEEALAGDAREIVLDNTYLTRASRSYVVEAATRHGISARCVWLDTALAQAQINLVERLLDRFGKLLTPEELNGAARSEPGVLSPTRQMRSFRELEAPADDEGFAVVERVPFERAPAKGARGSGVLVAAAAVGARGWEEALAGADPKAPHLVFDWRPDGATADLAAAVSALAGAVSGSVEAAICPHPGGAPICWCRVPLPGLPLAFARRHGIDLTRSILLGTSAAHRTLATALGARHLSLDRTDAS
jgi:aryl-alcohol dehydrogenase-like predicted oxidoreductase/predicted kinase